MMWDATIARMIDYSLLPPVLTDAELHNGCRHAIAIGCASVCIKPYAVPLAAKLLAGSQVAVGTVIGFPHGGNLTEAKVFEAQAACRQGATELDMVVNVGKVLSRDWDYVAADIRAVAEAAHAAGAIVKVIFENDFLPDDALKIKLCEVCREAGADFVKTSTGYGFVRQPGGGYNYRGATEHDVALMKRHAGPTMQVKAAGGVRTHADAVRMRELGATRIGTSAPEPLLVPAADRPAASGY
ncbi:MAG: deoxyribose-phosphate aldolase [Planctomycetia bacterium]|nr:deoxyribose-phosphate aldolase [Planctomycetia bacterium]